MRTPQEQRKHVTMWLAVGGTTAAVVALWVLVLPMQLGGARQTGAQHAMRWGTASTKAPQPKKQLTEIIEEQKLQLQQLDAARETGAASPSPAELLTRIEAATVAKSTTTAK